MVSGDSTTSPATVAGLQLTADPQFRGRVMALWSVTFTDSTPIGGPVVGVIADDLGPATGWGSAPSPAWRPRELDWPAYQQAHETHT